MSKIILNYKICDQAPECSGISTCPNHAIYFDETQNCPVWDESKCTFCLKCTLPNCCPVGAIMYAGDEAQEKSIIDTLNSDPHDENWLWLERYGVAPSIRSPQAIILTEDNFSEVLSDTKNKIIDVWRPEDATCRLKSPLFSELISPDSNIAIYKLNAEDFPELAKKLEVTVFPTLLVYNSANLVNKFEGALSEDNIISIKNIQINS